MVHRGRAGRPGPLQARRARRSASPLGGGDRMIEHVRRTLLVAIAVALVACSSSGDDGSVGVGTTGGDPGGEDIGDCTPVDVAVSPEKVELLTELARLFNQ